MCPHPPLLVPEVAAAVAGELDEGPLEVRAGAVSFSAHGIAAGTPHHTGAAYGAGHLAASWVHP